MAPLKAKILISSILLIVLLMLPDEATSQRRRRGVIAPNTAQNDSLHGNDSLKADTVVAFLFDWSDYMYNTNYAMRVKTYEDDDTEDQITKAVMICDGKAIDLNSLVTVTKKYSA